MTLSASPIPRKTIVLIGMMGSGKSAVGRKLAARLNWPFVDSDAELEAAAGMTIARYFEQYGEPSFRQGEQRLIARLLQGPRAVLSTGGGAFMDPATRILISQCAYSIWLKADLNILVNRTEHRDDRPLLKGGLVREKLAALLTEREPVYAEADITVISDNRPPDDTAERVLAAVQNFEKRHP